MSEKNEETLVEILNEINSNLNEIKNEQINLKALIEKNNKILMQRINKLQDYNEINDMRNQYFNREISKIEGKIEDLYY